jgi:transcriptional regulator with XRE-family HTH domain
MGIGTRLRERREALQLSGRELGRRAEIAESHVGLIESGVISSPRKETVEALATALECEPSWLLFGGEPPPAPQPEPASDDGAAA